ncbi:hypothetical protein [Bradyrhizobium elkanii]|uniref:hypothetical protein n=1 Tax=Bradyrhizobium elkanii TaxID=29448 RepID=UPI00209EF6A3|nr:hypothetical protein [Bradyrhizobium elkanii]MCP1969775.1 hypothetical protein [Bradyrhizobium elkanii]MCS4108717.1 hypothetical protein [Bradyrhizobium elkanii]
MADRIVQRISLEGAEDVQAKLKKTGEIGAKALAATNRTIEDSNSGLGKYGDIFAGLNGKTEGSRAAIERVKKVVETIKPAAATAGIELGGVGDFAKLSRTNVIAFAAAVTGAFVAAMEKAGDTARSQAQRLGVFTGSAQSGVEAYKELQKTAGELKVPTSTLTDPFEQIARTNQRFGNKLSGSEQTNALKSLFTGSEADRVDDEQANPAIKTFLTGLREGGRLTPELASGLGDIMPTLMKRLLQDLQTRLPNANVYSAPETLKSLSNILPQLEEDQRTTQTTFGTGISQSLSHLKAEAAKLGDSLNGTQIVSTAIDGAAKFLGATAEGVKAIREARHEADFKNDLRPNPPAVRATSRYRSPGDVPLSPDELGTPGVSAQPVNKIIGGEGDQTVAAENMDQAAKSAENLSKALDKTTESADGAQHVFDRDRALHLENALGAAGAKFATEQARIDSKYRPEETDIGLGRDQLAVQNAAIAKQSAQIGVQDAAKNKELANLAPEQAESASRSAESRYTKALSNLRRLQGYDTSFLDRTNPIRDALDELNDADTARKVADVNRRYAYLEPRKAELAQQKAQTDLTSADYLQRDSSLKLAKDREGRQLSTDVAGLRYQQAQLDEQKKISELGDDEVKLLAQILSTLQKQSEERSNKSEDSGSGAPSGGAPDRRLGDVSGSGSSGSFSSRSAGSSAPESLGGEKLIEKSGVVNIPRDTPQDQINDAFAKRGALPPVKYNAPSIPESDIDDALAKFKQHGTKLQTIDPEAWQKLQALSDRTDGSHNTLAPTTQEELDRTLRNQRRISQYEGVSQNELMKGVADQLGGGSDKIEAARRKQHGVVPHPHGGKADLSERQYPGGPLRYRYTGGDANLEPPQMGYYGDDGQLKLLPDSQQPSPRLRPKPLFSDRPYNKLEDVFDFGGDGGRNTPIYNSRQPNPLSFPGYQKDLRDTLPLGGNVPLPQPRPVEADQIQGPIPLPQPRPAEAAPGQQSSLPSTQEVAALGDAFRSLIEGISASINSAKQQNNAVDNPEAMGIRGEGESAPSSDGAGEAADKAGKGLEEFAQAVAEATNAVRKKSVEEDDATYAATGGFISGPGSTTSDSVPAMLSNEEYVLNAKAAKRIGKTNLDAINFGGRGLHHFAIGGPVGFMGDIGLPHVSAASIANVGGADHLGTVDLRTNHGDFSVGASRSTLDDLQKASVMAQLARTGTPPSWSGA